MSEGIRDGKTIEHDSTPAAMVEQLNLLESFTIYLVKETDLPDKDVVWFVEGATKGTVLDGVFSGYEKVADVLSRIEELIEKYGGVVEGVHESMKKNAEAETGNINDSPAKITTEEGRLELHQIHILLVMKTSLSYHLKKLKAGASEKPEGQIVQYAKTDAAQAGFVEFLGCEHIEEIIEVLEGLLEKYADQIKEATRGDIAENAETEE